MPSLSGNPYIIGGCSYIPNDLAKLRQGYRSIPNNDMVTGERPTGVFRLNIQLNKVLTGRIKKLGDSVLRYHSEQVWNR